MFQAHQTRTFRVVQYVSRMMGRERRPDLDHVRSTLRPIIDHDLPYWVATDAEVWATTDDLDDAIAFAKRIAPLLYPGERIVVTMHGVSMWQGKGGTDYSTLRTVPCDDCGRSDGTHNPEVEH